MTMSRKNNEGKNRHTSEAGRRCLTRLGHAENGGFRLTFSIAQVTSVISFSPMNYAEGGREYLPCQEESSVVRCNEPQLRRLYSKKLNGHVTVSGPG